MFGLVQGMDLGSPESSFTSVRSPSCQLRGRIRPGPWDHHLGDDSCRELQWRGGWTPCPEGSHHPHEGDKM